MLRTVTGQVGGLLFGAALALSLGAGAGQAWAAQDSYVFDKGHTEIRYYWNHVGMSTQSGDMREYDGTVVWDTENVENSSVNVTIKAASLDTGVAALDTHLKGPDFFDVETYPDITFKSTGVKKTGVNRGRITGDLTMKGVTKPVTLDVQLLFTGDHPLAAIIPSYAGAPYAAFSARGDILRSEFGMGFGAPLTSDHITIVIETEMRRTN